MRFQRTAALATSAMLWLLLGPVVLLLAVLLLVVPRVGPRVRAWLRPTWRVVAGWAAAVVVLVGVVVVVPDGWLPVPPGSGALVTPSYVGRPARAQPIDLGFPQHPAMAPNGKSSMHHDGAASDAYAWAGPLGESPEVDTAWYGLEECATLAFDSHDRLVALCGTRSGPLLRVIDPETLRPLATKDLPDRRDTGTRVWEDLCGGSYFYLDDRDRAVLATTDRRVLVVATSDADGDADLTTEEAYDLSALVPEDDCVIALMPDWAGRVWFVTRDGRVGAFEPGGDEAGGYVLELGEDIANSLAVDRHGVYVVTTHALYRLVAGRDGRPRVDWRTAYDRGEERKPGQLTQGSGTTPTLLPGGLVAITDNAEPRMHVAFHDAGDGALVCRAAVFDDDASATENSLVPVGDGGVVVENNHGYAGPWSTLLGRATTGGFARVDVDRAAGECTVAWTSTEVAPTSVAKVSLATGLVYAYTKRSSWWGVDAWYLTAIDARTGKRVWAVRTGLGPLMNNHYAAVTIGADASVYVATPAGLVRVRDRD
ncbi:hypothetical protein [Nocardioides ferulae]|uniref:hypothetical protein n=1 Tax=Nocardioides ferulae TaxID=2340821 RepID=UPI000EB50485|nr:hypothetical protein [Nocardioides ferulae]